MESINYALLAGKLQGIIKCSSHDINLVLKSKGIILDYSIIEAIEEQLKERANTAIAECTFKDHDKV